MNREHAKRILLRYRPGTRSDSDPELSHALEAANEDPALREWLVQHAAAQFTIASILRNVPPPENLKEQILSRKIVPLWQRPGLWLAAASIVCLIALSLPFFRPPAEDLTWRGFEARMLRFAIREYRMDILTNDAQVVRDYLASHGAPSDFPLPQGLAARPVKGGARLSWQNKPVAMICFEGGVDQTLYLFVIDQSAVEPSHLPGSAPAIGTFSRLATASWRESGRIYLLAAPGNEAELKQWLGEPISWQRPGAADFPILLTGNGPG